MSFDIEKALVKFFTDKGFSAYCDVPAERPNEFIIVERTGGSSDSVVIDRPAVALQCYGGTRLKASALAYCIDELIPEFTSISQITHAKRNSLYSFPDLARKLPRYQIVIDLATRKI